MNAPRNMTLQEFPTVIRATDLGEFLTDEDSEDTSDDVLLCCSDLDGPVQPDSSAMELMEEMARRYNAHVKLLAALTDIVRAEWTTVTLQDMTPQHRQRLEVARELLK